MAEKSTPAQVKADLRAAREAAKKLRRIWKVAKEIVQEEIASEEKS